MLGIGAMSFSASRTGLLFECQYSFRPDVQGPPEDESSEKAAYGTRVHERAEQISRGKLIYVAADLTPELTDAIALANYVTRLPGDPFYEIKLAYDPTTRTARTLTNPEPRDYTECTPTELPGTADFIALDVETAYVVDYKTGSTSWEAYRDQLNFLALAACRKRGLTRAVCIVLKVFNGETYDRAWVLEREDLDAFEERLIRVARNIPSAEPQPGVHCVGQFCRLAGTCPATKANITGATDIPMDRVFTDGSVTDDEHFRDLYETRRLLKRAEQDLTTALQRYVGEERLIELRSGKKYGKVAGKFQEKKA